MVNQLLVLVNSAGGAAASAGDALSDMLVSAFIATGVTADVRILGAGAMGAAIASAVEKRRRIVVAGGDGTAACAAQAIIGSDAELALLPLGTLNHLARDLGIPADLNAAAEVAAHGAATRIDVGEVNGRRFVNNVSIGIYPSMIRERDAHRQSRGWPKWLATIPAAWQAISGLRRHRLRIDMGQGEQPLITPLLLVGNNGYLLDAGKLGSRASLQDGMLSVYAVSSRSRLSLIWFAVRALLGRVDREADFVALGTCEALTVRASRPSVEIAIDGELCRMACPLIFRMHAGALRIATPRDPSVSEEAACSWSGLYDREITARNF